MVSLRKSGGGRQSKQYRDLPEVIDDRIGRGATLLTSQYPVAQWHDLIGHATVADALLDPSVHNALAASSSLAIGRYDRGAGHPKTGPRRTLQTASKGSNGSVCSGATPFWDGPLHSPSDLRRSERRLRLRLPFPASKT